MTPVTTQTEPPRAAAENAEAAGYVTLHVAEQLCGIPVLSVRDVLAAQRIAAIPLAPAEIAGNLNLRGRIVTAIDLRPLLDLPRRPAGVSPMSIVIERGTDLYAVLADTVGEVVSLRSDMMEANPPGLAPRWAEHSRGIFRVDYQLMVVLDLERVFRVEPGEAA